MLKLFIIMWFMDGTVVTYLHKDNMTALQCSQAASFEVQRLRESDTSNMRDIDVVCGTAKDLVGGLWSESSRTGGRVLSSQELVG